MVCGTEWRDEAGKKLWQGICFKLPVMGNQQRLPNSRVVCPGLHFVLEGRLEIPPAARGVTDEKKE